MTRGLAILLTLAALSPGASAQQRVYYDANGKAVARSRTDSQGTTTLYGRDGRVISRESTTGNTTTVYDGASGRIIGKVTKDKR